MKQRKIVYSQVALTKRKIIKKDIKEKYGEEKANKFSNHVTRVLAELKKYPQMGSSIREKYGSECEYYILFVEHNYFVYRITEEMIMILEIFHEKEDFIYQMFGVTTTSQETLDYWNEDS